MEDFKFRHVIKYFKGLLAQEYHKDPLPNEKRKGLRFTGIFQILLSTNNLRDILS